MFKILKPFFKYDFILVVLLLFMEVIIRLHQEGISFVFILCIYIPVLLLLAPILFGLQYGRSIIKKQTLSSNDKLKLSGIIFVLSYITYLLPYFDWNFKFTKMLLRLSPYTLLPSILITAVFFCTVTFHKNMKDNKKTSKK